MMNRLTVSEPQVTNHLIVNDPSTEQERLAKIQWWRSMALRLHAAYNSAT